MAQTFAGSATLKDVAAQAEVSQSTVSRALTHPEKVAPETRGRILKIAAKLNYQPNQLARGLKQQNTKIIGLILTDILNDFYARIAKGVQSAVYKQGYTVMLCNTDEDTIREESFLQELQRHRFGGLIIVPTERTKSHLKKYASTPVVELDRASGIEGAHVVMADNVESSKAAVRHLQQLGHTRIGTVRGQLSVTTGEERLRGYLEGMKEANLSVSEAWIVGAEQHGEAQGYAAAQQLLSLADEIRPTAIFAFNNEVTAGVLRAAKAAGLVVPRDLSVLGFDDSRWAQLMSPALTVVSQPAFDMGYLAAERLFSLISHPNIRGTVTRLTTTLIVRESTAPPLKGS